MLIFTQYLSLPANASVDKILFTLPLWSFERLKSRYRFELDDGQVVFIQLKRGTILQDGDILQTETGECLKIIAKPEPVLTITTSDRHLLLRTVYHLGNRHVPVEITPDYLRIAPDPVLQQMLEHLGVDFIAEIQPFYPEIGAYHQH
ncbi:urease accessory protein UreE [Aphanothece hegewaldii CCALA 016]|uniref:Urease accessory protein UreE n=1 Tax=Aphanothece hegewaldii CCALA 016 TaxID=2107694 RepID=A0A2T1LUW1_9CHRO|nr:urease accessory protein UreE [Aphanothece hegewaldii]PSF35413.1 urease accessory protein UreE [Aphanothece hegewaldii CCALA 016]